MLRLSLLTALLSLTGLLHGQRPGSFVPAPVVAAPGAVDHLGKMLWFVEGSDLHAFSATTRRWVTVPVTASTTVRQANDWLLVTDTSFVAAMSSTRGVFDVLPVSSGATVLNAPSARNDGIVLVLDGSTLWSFSGFRGRWTSLVVRPSAVISVQRNVAIVSDGNQLLGMSALTGDWVPQTTTHPVAAIGSADTAGWATDGLDGFGFSAIRGLWARHPLPAGAPAAPMATRDAVLWMGSQEALAFSGVRGAFAATPIQGGSTATLADHWAHVVDPTGTIHRMFSVPNADWVALTTAPAPTLQMAEATGLFVEAGRVVGYSALLSTTTALGATAAASSVNATVGAVLDAATMAPHLFSSMSGTWHRAPSPIDPALPILARNGAILQDTSGGRVVAFTPRGDRFVPRTVAGNPSLHSNSGSSVIAVEDDAHLAVFEPRRGAWLETQLSATDRPLDLRIWRTVLVAAGDRVALGYSAASGALERGTFAGHVLELRASSEVGAVITDAEVVAFAAVPDLHTDAQFPEFRRMFGRGATLDLHANGPAGALVGAVSGIAPGPAVVLPGLGEFLLDPNAVIPVPVGSLDPDGTTVLRLPIPDLPTLRGVELGFQAVVVPTGAPAYLTQLASLRIH